MTPLPPLESGILTAEDVEMITFLVGAPNQTVAAEWLGYSSTHLRRRLRRLRKRLRLETNGQLIVLASITGSINPCHVLPSTVHTGPEPCAGRPGADRTRSVREPRRPA